MAALLAAPAAGARAARSDGELLRAYARAEASADAEEASAAYALLLAASPDSPLIAERAMRRAVAVGDRALALRAAALVVAGNPGSPEARLLLLDEARSRRRWDDAEAQLAGLAREPVFGLLVPILRAWVDHDRGRADAAVGLSDPAVAAYAGEHRALLLVVQHGPAAAGEVERLAASDARKAERLRIVAASELARRGKQDAATALLTGDERTIVIARDLIAATGRLSAGRFDGGAGISELLGRVAADIVGQDAPETALAYARLADLISPANGAARLLAAELLAARGDADRALAILQPLVHDPLYADAADEARIRILSESDRFAEAVAAASAGADRVGGAVEWGRLGDALMGADRFAEAAAAFGRALTAPRTSGAPAEWLLHLLRGSALDQAGGWTEAKAALERAHALAPDEAIVLNYLGYAQIEKRENIAAAQALIEQAARLRPDDAAITDSLGWSYFLRGRTAEAIPLLEKAAAGSADDPAIHEHLGDAYYTAGRRVEARFAWDRALAGIKPDGALRVRAKIDRGLSPELAAP